MQPTMPPYPAHPSESSPLLPSDEKDAIPHDEDQPTPSDNGNPSTITIGSHRTRRPTNYEVFERVEQFLLPVVGYIFTMLICGVFALMVAGSILLLFSVLTQGGSIP